MLQARITIDGREHFIPPEHDPEAIMRTITEQVRAGGGFVELVRTCDRTVRVLVSPGMSLSIEVVCVHDVPDGIDAEVEPLARSYLDVLDVL